MFKSIKKYVQFNPINTVTYTICSTTTSITLVDILSEGKIDTVNIAALSLTGLAAIGATASSIYRKMAYDATCRLIKKYGFFREILQDKRSRKLVKIFAEEHNRIDEYQHALEQYQHGIYNNFWQQRN